MAENAANLSNLPKYTIPVGLGKYTVLFSDGISNGALLPESPSKENTVSSLKAAKALFKSWMRDSGNDYGRADGYGAPSAAIYLTEGYDGIFYGDYPRALFTRGINGGVVSESL